VPAKVSAATALLAFLVTVPAAAPLVSARAGQSTGASAGPRTIAKADTIREPKNGHGYVRAPRPIKFSVGAGRSTKLFVRPGERVKRGQLLARTERPGLQRRLRSAETALENARSRLSRAKGEASERNRRAQASAARASVVRNAQNALEATRAQAKTRSAASEQGVARAREALTEAQRSALARDRSLRAAADRAQDSLERARRAANAARAEVDRRVAAAKEKLGRAQDAARDSGDRLQAAVTEAEQTVAAARNSQAANAQGYQSAVDQAQARVGEAESTLSSDQDKVAAARSDRDRYEAEVGSRREKVDELHARVKSDKGALDACSADAQPGGCAGVQDRYDRDAAKLEDEKARLASAESNLAGSESILSSLKQTVADDQAAVASAKSALADAQQQQSSGQAEDAQRVQAAEDALANARASAASGASADQASVSQARRSLDSANSTRNSRLSRDRQALARAGSSVASAQGERAAGRSSGERAVRSAQQALASARTAGNSTVARTEQEIAAAAAAFRDAQQSLGAALASTPTFANAPTPSDLAVAETKVELAELAVRSARDRLAEASELRAPASGTVASVPGSNESAGSISLTDLGVPQVTVSLAAAEATDLRVGRPATVTVATSPEQRLAAHVVSVGPALPSADGTSRREVTFALDENSPNLEPGMTARADIEPEEDETAARLERLRRRLAAQQDIAGRQDTGVVAIATRYLGVPYVWGGASPQSGFDCSGLVMYVYAQLGVSLPHFAASQYNYGIPVPRDRLEPGDLVFFHALGHVGIYVGNDEFIHAPHTGDVVKISTLNEFSYASTYVGARRLETPAPDRLGDNPVPEGGESSA
jgi:cell wall-associated NlpC family hydrolase